MRGRALDEISAIDRRGEWHAPQARVAAQGHFWNSDPAGHLAYGLGLGLGGARHADPRRAGDDASGQFTFPHRCLAKVRLRVQGLAEAAALAVQRRKLHGLNRSDHAAFFGKQLLRFLIDSGAFIGVDRDGGLVERRVELLVPSVGLVLGRGAAIGDVKRGTPAAAASSSK